MRRGSTPSWPRPARRRTTTPTWPSCDGATGIFLTGGNQLRLSSTIGGTRLSRAIEERHHAGAVVAGTSAGASALSTHMIAFGASGLTPKQRMAQISAGLGLLPGVIIDQHFQQRNRLGRLLALVAQNPSLLGIGIDEDTAGVVTPDQVFEVIGRGSVTIVDGTAAETDAWEVSGHRPLMISNVVMHSLPAGYRFDLRRRARIRDAGAPVAAPRGEIASRVGRRWPAPAPPSATEPAPAAERRPAPASRARPTLRILESRVLRGPNYWSPKPVVRMLVDLGRPRALAHRTRSRTSPTPSSG